VPAARIVLLLSKLRGFAPSRENVISCEVSKGVKQLMQSIKAIDFFPLKKCYPRQASEFLFIHPLGSAVCSNLLHPGRPRARARTLAPVRPCSRCSSSPRRNWGCPPPPRCEEARPHGPASERGPRSLRSGRNRSGETGTYQVDLL